MACPSKKDKKRQTFVYPTREFNPEDKQDLYHSLVTRNNPNPPRNTANYNGINKQVYNVKPRRILSRPSQQSGLQPQLNDSNHQNEGAVNANILPLGKRQYDLYKSHPLVLLYGCNAGGHRMLHIHPGQAQTLYDLSKIFDFMMMGVYVVVTDANNPQLTVKYKLFHGGSGQMVPDSFEKLQNEYVEIDGVKKKLTDLFYSRNDIIMEHIQLSISKSVNNPKNCATCAAKELNSLKQLQMVNQEIRAKQQSLECIKAQNKIFEQRIIELNNAFQQCNQFLASNEKLKLEINENMKYLLKQKKFHEMQSKSQ